MKDGEQGEAENGRDRERNMHVQECNHFVKMYLTPVSVRLMAGTPCLNGDDVAAYLVMCVRNRVQQLQGTKVCRRICRDPNGWR